MGNLTTSEILSFLKELGAHCSQPATIFLVGGSALCLLGSPRRTLDIDYTADPQANELRKVIASLASQMRLEIDEVPIDEFIPLPDQASMRHRLVGQFGKLIVYVFDPYSIAVSKVARGFDSDIEDVLFLLGQRIIELDWLEKYVKSILPYAGRFDVAPDELQTHLRIIQRLYRAG